MLLLTLSSLILAVFGVVGLQLPNLTGPYSVGTVIFELVDESRVDPYAPTPQPRDLMLSMFYPTSKAAVQSGNYPLADYMPAKTAAGLTSYIGNSSKILTLATQSFLEAPILNEEFPVLFFDPGFGGSRFLNTAQLEDLASQGWIIITLDHPYDSKIVEYPDGRTVGWIPSLIDDFPTHMPMAIDVRVADIEFVARALRNETVLARIPGLTSACKGTPTLHSHRFGIFGHSLGGATAAQTMANSTRFGWGANFDGGIYGPVADTGLDKPFIQIEAENHYQDNDTTFNDFYYQLHGFRRQFIVNGTMHWSFFDFPILRDLLGEEFPAQSRNESGSIAGKRILEIDTVLMNDFFGYCLKGKPVAELDKLVTPQGGFPEISVPAQL